jgi:hypothetical protein
LVIPVWFSLKLVKVELVDTCTPYEAAPVDAFHSSLGVRLDTVEPLVGNFRVGAAGGGGSVVAEASSVDKIAG